MKKKIILSVLLIAVLGLVGWLGVKTFGRIQHKKQVEANLKTLPTQAKLLGIDSSRVYLGNSKVVIFFFDPDCEHCQSEAEAIKKNAVAFAGVQLLWMSITPLERLRSFEQKYGIQKAIPNLRIVQISAHDANHQFGFRTVPTILIYNAQHQLSKQYTGETKVEAILKYL